MIRNTIRMAMLAAALIVGLPVWADYETGQRAWDAGHLDEALTQWRAAADAGDRRAMLALGRLYVRGPGAPQDYLEAHKWFNLAASRGEAVAVGERDALAAKMTPQQVAAAQERAAAWHQTASRAAGNSQVAGATEPTSDAGQPPPRAIRESQELLGSLGYAPGPVDGVWGARTAHAYREFLQDAGLPAVEMLTPEALRAMRAVAKRQAGREAMERRRAATTGDASGVQSQVSGSTSLADQAEALHRAARTGDVRGLDAALAAGADVEARDGRGWSPLMHAVNNGYILFVEALLAAGANPDIRAPDGATALFMAALHGHAEIFARLLEADADASIPGPQGKTPLDVAQLRGDSTFLALPGVVALVGAEAARKERDEAARRTQADTEAFSKAKSLEIRQAYKDYLSAWCPGGNHCDAARRRHSESIRANIAGKTFSGPTPYVHTDRDRTLTLRFFPSGALEAYYFGSLGDALYSGEWRVEGDKVRLMNLRGLFWRLVGVAEFDDNALAGHLRDPDEPVTFRNTWRLTENPAEPAVDGLADKRRATQDDHRSNGK